MPPIFYPEWYARFVSRTDEKELLPKELEKILGENKGGSCLEIGLGIGPHFAEVLAPHFDNYQIIEKRKTDPKLPKGVQLVNADWEQYKSEQGSDVIIASHVIYYFKDLKKGVDKVIDSLNDKGRAFFVVNGANNNYGALKSAFEVLRNHNQPTEKLPKYTFTYHRLMEALNGRKFKEHVVPTAVSFSSPVDLFETLKISFDNYPGTYDLMKGTMVAYIKDNLRGDRFYIDQKIIEVSK
ncbi:MAG: class I SAM-dependent methyltransferase [Nanoarchaeota archaeon]|nr:class I SAM-dependent methyltransferase [Nanoarchaeota archaeon]